ncbi:MAG: peptidylprolyl isomerase [Candidatus Brocadiales bacterium]
MKRLLRIRFSCHSLLTASFGTILFLYMLHSPNVTIAGKETASALSRSSEVVAVVNDQNITRADLGDFLIERFGGEVLDIMIRRTLVYQEAKKLGVEISPEELSERIEKITNFEIERYMKMSGLSSAEELEKSLKKIGGTIKRFRESIAGRASKELEVQMLGEKIVGKTITVAEEDLRRAYEEKYGEKIVASQIVVRSKKDGEEILNKIKAGADFEALARKESIDRSSAAKGGMMQPFSSKSTFGRAVASLPKGKTSDLIKTEYGYHILKIIDIKPKSDVRFEAVKAELKKLVRAGLIRQRAASWLITVEESANIKKNFKD